MKRIFLIVSLIVLFMSGCTYNLDGFVVPNDIQFLECIEELDTVEKIARYMEDNFTFKLTPFGFYSPYQMWQHKIGDCNDYAAFGVNAARQHNIEAYQVYIEYEECNHVNAVYKVGDYWHLTDSWVHYFYFDTIDSAIKWHTLYSGRTLKKYKILGD